MDKSGKNLISLKNAYGNTQRIAQDETTTFFLTNGWLLARAAKGESPIERVNSLLDGAKMQSLALDRDFAYVADATSGHIFVVRKTAPIGDIPQQLEATGTTAVEVRVDEGFAYWADGEHIVRQQKDGASRAEVLAPSARPSALALDTTYVYWSVDPGPSAGGTLYRVRKDGQSQSEVLVAGAARVGGIATDERAVYFTDRDHRCVYRVDK